MPASGLLQEASKRTKEEFENGEGYEKFHDSFVWREKEVCLHLRRIANQIKIKKNHHDKVFNYRLLQ
mgnify:CR=1 FL=1